MEHNRNLLSGAFGTSAGIYKLYLVWDQPLTEKFLLPILIAVSCALSSKIVVDVYAFFKKKYFNPWWARQWQKKP